MVISPQLIRVMDMFKFISRRFRKATNYLLYFTVWIVSDASLLTAVIEHRSKERPPATSADLVRFEQKMGFKCLINTEIKLGINTVYEF